MFLDMSMRSLWRHKTRSFLTVMGIVLAIAAIVSLGSISEGINGLVEAQLKMASNFIGVIEAGQGATQGPPGMYSKIPREVLDEVAQIDGVVRTLPNIHYFLVESNLFIVAMPLDALDYFDLENVRFKEGDWPMEGEKALAIGFQTSEYKGLRMGDEIDVKGDSYIVSGVIEELGSFMDYGAFTSLDAAADSLDFEDYYSEIVVEPADVGDSARIANEIEEQYDYLEAITSEEAIQRARGAIDSVKLITLGIGVIASIVASIGIVNTMLIIVIERRGEFGIMKALGAEKNVILMMVLQEAVLFGIIGSTIGVLIGFAGTSALNSAMGMPLAEATPTLVVFSFTYGVLLSVLASLYPSLQAIKVDAAEAMRSQM